MVKVMTWTKLNRSFSGCCGWRQIRRQSRPRKHLTQNVATVEAAIVAERKFVDVVLQIFPAHAMVCAVNAPFELRPKTFDGIGVSAVNDIFPRAVIDANVFESKFRGEVIDW